MNTLVFIITILAVAFTGMTFGFMLGRPAPHSDLLPYICACKHPFGAHDLRTGACHDKVERQLYNALNHRAGKEWVECACMRYAGPEPLQSFIPRSPE